MVSSSVVMSVARSTGATPGGGAGSRANYTPALCRGTPRNPCCDAASKAPTSRRLSLMLHLPKTWGYIAEASMAQFHLLDRLMGEQRPDLGTDAQLRAFEATPYDERIAAQSTYEALQLGAAPEPRRAGPAFPAQRRPGRTAAHLSHRQFIGARHAGRQPVPRAGRRPDRRGELPAAAVARELHAAVRRAGRGHRQPGQPAAGAGADRARSCARPTPRCWWRWPAGRAPTSGQKVERIRERAAGARRRSSWSRRRRNEADARLQTSTRWLAAQPSRPAASAAAASRPATSPPTSTPAAPPARPSWCATATRNQVYQAWAARPDAAEPGNCCCSACRCSMSAAR